MVNKNELGLSPKDAGIKAEGNHMTERLECIDVNNLRQMQGVLGIVTDPVNMKHLAGVSERTGISDIIQHYKKTPEERDGRVLSDGDNVIAVFDISPMDWTRVGMKPEEDKDWGIRSSFLNRLAVRSDVHGKGIGTRVIEYAEEVAFRVHGYPSLQAAIILDNDQARAFDETFKGNAQKFAKEYMRNDARGKIFLGNRKWQISGIIRDQGGYREGESNSVLLIQKRRTAWEEEQGLPHQGNGASMAV